METKTGKVLKYLVENKSITSWEAIKLFRATRLSGIIYNLKARGHVIESIRVQGENEEGEKSWFVRYIYKGEKECVK